MMLCSICNQQEVSSARFEATGYTHCTHVECIAAWRRIRIEQAGLVLVKQHKQGPMWIYKSEVKKNSMKRDNGIR